MNQAQFVHELMELLFGWDYEYLTDEDCSYELALGMIKEKYKKKEEPEKKKVVRRPSLKETQAMQARNRGGY